MLFKLTSSNILLARFCSKSEPLPQPRGRGIIAQSQLSLLQPDWFQVTGVVCIFEWEDYAHFASYFGRLRFARPYGNVGILPEDVRFSVFLAGMGGGTG